MSFAGIMADTEDVTLTKEEIEQLEEVPGFGSALALKVFAGLHAEQDDPEQDGSEAPLPAVDMDTGEILD